MLYLSNSLRRWAFCMQWHVWSSHFKILCMQLYIGTKDILNHKQTFIFYFLKVIALKVAFLLLCYFVTIVPKTKLALTNTVIVRSRTPAHRPSIPLIVLFSALLTGSSCYMWGPGWNTALAPQSNQHICAALIILQCVYVFNSLIYCTYTRNLPHN